MTERVETKQRISPRTQSWIAVILPYLTFVVAVSSLPIPLALVPVIVSSLGAGVFRMLQKCPVCGVSLARVPIDFCGVKLQIYTPLTPRRCPNGHPLDRRASEST